MPMKIYFIAIFFMPIVFLSCFAYNMPFVERIKEIGYCYEKDATIFDTFRNHKSYVHFIKQGKNRFIVKQMIPENIEKQFCLIREALASHIAESLNIPVNRVRIIPRDVYFPGKIFIHRVATLHTFAKGKSLLEPGKYKGLKIKQFLTEELPKKECGLTLQVIHNMSLHPDLPRIVAFDTFIGNADRGSPNIYYNQKTDRFCGIDMEISFYKNLCEIACFQIQRLLKGKVKLTKRELGGIKKYCKTLKKLIEKYPPETVITVLDKLCSQAGFTPTGNFVLQSCIRWHKRKIQENYASAQKLVVLLDQLVAKYARYYVYISC